jgi:hypothetical protein
MEGHSARLTDRPRPADEQELIPTVMQELIPTVMQELILTVMRFLIFVSVRVSYSCPFAVVLSGFSYEAAR